MDVKIVPCALDGVVEAVPYKSLACRYFLASILADSPTEIDISSFTEDLEILVKCLKEIGAGIRQSPVFLNKWTVTPVDVSEDLFQSETEINVGDNFAVLKFLLPIVSGLGLRAMFKVEKKLKDKNVEELLSVLTGANPTDVILPVTLTGKLQGNEFIVPEGIGSQFVCGLLLALPLLSNDSVVKFTGKEGGLNSTKLTLKVMEEFGIKYEKTDNAVTIFGNQKYASKGSIFVEGDYTASVPFLAVGAFGANVKVNNLKEDSTQADKIILDVLADFKKGAKAFNLNKCADFTPYIAFISCFRNFDTEITGVKKLRKNEDKILSIVNVINKMGGVAEATEDGLIIHGTGELKGGVYVDCENDGKLAMALCIASAYAKEPVTVLSVEGVKKISPTFFNDFNKLGGKCSAL